MRISHLSFSKAGGAGSVALNLSEALRSIGVDSIVEHSIESDLRKSPLALPTHTIAAGLDEYLVKNQNFSNPVSVLRERLSEKLAQSARDADVLNLHWTPGQVSIKNVGEHLDSGKAIVWTLHDMWPFTAVCHYAGACEKFKNGCQSCPAVKPLFQNLATKSFAIKRGIFDRPRENLVFVAPSKWIANLAHSSTLLKNQRVEVVPNPVANTTEESSTLRSSPGWRRSLDVGQDSFLIAFTAANLADKRKNLFEVIEALSDLSRARSDLNLVLVLIGRGAVPEIKGLAIKNLGYLKREELNVALANCDVAVNFSRDENLSMAGIEALAVGTPLVVLNSGGNPELVSDNKTGYLVQDVIEFKARISELASNRSLVTQMGQASLQDFSSRFEASVVARRYLDLYNSLLKK